MKKQCEVDDCTNLAKHALFRTHSDGKKEWLNVCPLHERKIGDENMRQAGGRCEEVIKRGKSINFR